MSEQSTVVEAACSRALDLPAEEVVSLESLREQLVAVLSAASDFSALGGRFSQLPAVTDALWSVAWLGQLVAFHKTWHGYTIAERKKLRPALELVDLIIASIGLLAERGMAKK